MLAPKVGNGVLHVLVAIFYLGLPEGGSPAQPVGARHQVVHDIVHAVIKRGRDIQQDTFPKGLETMMFAQLIACAHHSLWLNRFHFPATSCNTAKCSRQAYYFL
jgi:hypothetical protein